MIARVWILIPPAGKRASPKANYLFDPQLPHWWLGNKVRSSKSTHLIKWDNRERERESSTQPDVRKGPVPFRISWVTHLPNEWMNKCLEGSQDEVYVAHAGSYSRKEPRWKAGRGGWSLAPPASHATPTTFFHILTSLQWNPSNECTKRSLWPPGLALPRPPTLAFPHPDSSFPEQLYPPGGKRCSSCRVQGHESAC